MARQNARMRRSKPKWRIVETRVKGNAAVQVSELPLKVPRYSFKVGTAHFPDDFDADANNDVPPEVGPRLSIFNVIDAVELLKDLGEKYTTKRESRIDVIEERKAKWQESGEDSVDNDEDDELDPNEDSE